MAFDRRAWWHAYASLSATDQETGLAGEDLERLAVAAFLTGRDDASDDAWERAHRDWLRRGDIAGAARCAFWLAYGLLDREEVVRGGGWLARAERLLEDNGLDCVERGYVLVPAALRSMADGDAAAAHASFEEAGKVGARFADAGLTALSLMGRGQSLIQLGEIPEGLVLLDEAMVAATTDDVSPTVAGRVYCAVIDACIEVFDVGRAQSWTDALTRWCEAQVGLVQFEGVCLLHRAELMQLHGEWSAAFGEAQRACERLTAGHPALGFACYQRADLNRVRGEFDLAEAAYRQASQFGREPQPGLALMSLAQGDVDAAVAAIRRVLSAPRGAARAERPPHWRWRWRRMKATVPELLAACVEILLAAGDVEGARSAAGELAEAAARRGVPLLCALAGDAEGAVLLAAGDASSAIESLRVSCAAWQELRAPYEAARAQVLIGLACRQLGDDATAAMEFDSARSVFQQLGAGPDLARVERLLDVHRPVPGRLTKREIEVLALVAAGKTNHEIATALVVSDHTVRRHLQNIFTKLGVSSRAAATAFAFQHDLV
ncbi:MAG TPA: LuxR C-terminal-related transcriptional regulator [Acidimicrobiales bacterium]|nr:LuxR C-terminal-related transcriptional regulator [Acidimicrobiales bacterium]